MSKKSILIIGLVWPEPTSSAAGTRMLQLIKAFISNQYEVVFASAASKTEFSANLTSLGVTEKRITLNDSGFNTFIKEIDPQIVLFDRFMTEEQYGWRVSQECPQALKVLDTEDLHCLRHARQQTLKQEGSLVLDHLFSDLAKREMSSILRCDLSLIISEAEMDILDSIFKIPAEILHYLPFTEQEITQHTISDWKSFEEREGFVFIGNYLHEPNWNTLQVLKKQIWPALRKKLPGVKLHLYGAYSSAKVLQLHQEKELFYIKGRAADAVQSISTHRVMLAPIRFGAGLKGKFIDAMQSGTPVITTSVGAEAMQAELAWNGAIADEQEQFVEEAIKMYTQKDLWTKAQQNGIALLNQQFAKPETLSNFFYQIDAISNNLKGHRESNFFGQILQHQSANSSKYMSLWIEEKNKNKG